jgi:S1-C subfamily serine protease
MVFGNPKNNMGNRLSTTLSVSALLLSGLTAAYVFTGSSLGLGIPGHHDSNSSESSVQLMSHEKLMRKPSQHQLGILKDQSNLIADVAEAVAPSVVNIDVEKSANVRMGNQGDSMPFGPEFLEKFFGFSIPRGGPGGGQEGGAGVPEDSPFRPFFQRFPGGPGGGGFSGPMISGNGSGVVVDTQGHVLTNNHVVSNADKITVTLNDGRKFPAKVIGKDRFTDLAVLKMEGATGLKPAEMGKSAALRPGEWVLAIGSPLGFDHTVTLGIVSAISRRVPDLNTNVDFIQTDAAINPGNSGGPLVNLEGQVIGINTAISGSGQNIGFAIPVDLAKNVVNGLIAKGQITRPWIGLAMAELTPELAKSLGVSETIKGVVVAQVMPNSPAGKAGFQQGDIIQRIDGQMMQDAKQVQGLVREKAVNSPMNIQILRNGSMMALSVSTAQLPNDEMGHKPQ